VYAWIGLETGYKAFEIRREEIEKTWPKDDFPYIIEQSLKKVIDDKIDPAINGFTISVSNANGVFQYRSAVIMDLLPRTLPPGFSVIGHGTAQEGAYTIRFFAANDSNTALAIHSLQGNFGIVYAIRNNGLLHPEIISDVDEEEFADIITPQFGIKKIGSLPVPVESYFKRGNKAFEAGDYSKALGMFDKGLKISGHPLWASLQFNRGMVLNYLNRHEEAMQSFQLAVQKDSSFQSKILSFLTSPKKK
jgi:tetratricopeptide (TPR) repeat protein